MLNRSRSRLILTVTLVVAILFGLAPAAQAHHPDMSGSSACVAGQQVITWQLRNSESAKGKTMKIVKIEISASGKQPPAVAVTGFDKDDELPPREQPGSSVTGTTSVPGLYVGSVTLTVKGQWSGFGTESKTVKVDLPGGCTLPAAPSATINLSCADSGVKIVLSNTGGTAAAFTIKKNGSAIGSPASVGAGATVTKVYEMGEDETATFDVAAPTPTYSQSKSITRDCQKPGATITSTCAGGVVVTLTNTGAASPVTFKVLKNGAEVDSVTIAGGGAPVVKNYSLAEDEVATFSVTALSFTTVAHTVDNSCQNPTAAINSNCAAGTEVTVANTGGALPVTFTIKKNGAVVDTVVVNGADAAVVKQYTLAEDETAEFVVEAPGIQPSVTQKIVHDCQAPSASLADSCADGGAKVLLSNAGQNPVTFTIEKNGQPLETVEVPGNTQDMARIYDLGEDVDATVTVKAPGMEPVTALLHHDCQIPGVAFEPTCDDGLTIIFSNTGQSPVTFTVKKGDVALDPVPLNGLDEKKVSYALTEGEKAVFSVSAPGGLETKPFEVEHDCQQPETKVDLTCADGLVITLTNIGGKSPAEFTVTINGKEQQVTVAPDGTELVKQAEVAEDSMVEVRISDGDPATEDTTASLPRDCQKPVALLGHNCGLGGVLATFANKGTEPVTFTVKKNDDPLTTVEVKGDSETTQVFTMAEDEKSTFTLTAPGMAEPVTLVATHDCQIPAASLAGGCETDGVVVTLANGGQLPVSFVVTKDGAQVGELSIGPGVKAVITYPVAEDASATIGVTAPGMTPLEGTFKRDCQDGPGVEVLGIVVTKPAIEEIPPTVVLPESTTRTLPRTGGSFDRLVPGALGLTLAGLLLQRLHPRKN